MSHYMFFCVCVVYSDEYDACGVTLSVYPHRASLKNMPGHGGNRIYDLWNTSQRQNHTIICFVAQALEDDYSYFLNLATYLHECTHEITAHS